MSRRFSTIRRERGPWLSLLMVALLLAAAAATLVVGKETEHLFDLAGRVYRATHGH